MATPEVPIPDSEDVVDLPDDRCDISGRFYSARYVNLLIEEMQRKNRLIDKAKAIEASHKSIQSRTLEFIKIRHQNTVDELERRCQRLKAQNELLASQAQIQPFSTSPPSACTTSTCTRTPPSARETLCHVCCTRTDTGTATHDRQMVARQRDDIQSVKKELATVKKINHDLKKKVSYEKDIASKWKEKLGELELSKKKEKARKAVVSEFRGTSRFESGPRTAERELARNKNELFSARWAIEEKGEEVRTLQENTRETQGKLSDRRNPASLSNLIKQQLTTVTLTNDRITGKERDEHAEGVYTGDLAINSGSQESNPAYDLNIPSPSTQELLSTEIPFSKHASNVQDAAVKKESTPARPFKRQRRPCETIDLV
eukprot:CFRG6404T1